MAAPRHQQIRSALRKIWLWSPERREAKARARVSRGVYRCEMCHQLFPKIEIDHMRPLGSTPGSRNATIDTTWDGLIERLFCPADMLRALCKDCHKKAKPIN